ncbi:MAG: SMP-30/gluconolactonase/LRE family protein [Propionibacteriaceae bacterium]|jgi:gluconolactonase|nr:SMP-30/gluconolactonase/LRE family protein [Propionibacteriaceae bacterium]
MATLVDSATATFTASDVTVLAAGFEFIEGPVWQAETSRLLFNDIPGDTAYSWSAAEGVLVVRQPSHKANGQVIDPESRVVVCEHLTNAVVVLEPDGARRVLAHDYQGQELNSPNDVIVGADSSVLFTDPPFGRIEAPMGAIRPMELGFSGVYQWQQDRGLRLLTTRLAQPNGLCLSIDQARLYVNDTATGDIVEFATSWRDSGLQLDDGRVLARVPQERAKADGLKIDARGNIWCTGAEGLYVFDCCGVALGVVAVEEPVANFAWGGVDGRDLYLASTTTLRRVRTTVAGAAWV